MGASGTSTSHHAPYIWSGRLGPKLLCPVRKTPGILRQGRRHLPTPSKSATVDNISGVGTVPGNRGSARDWAVIWCGTALRDEELRKLEGTTEVSSRELHAHSVISPGLRRRSLRLDARDTASRMRATTVLGFIFVIACATLARSQSLDLQATCATQARKAFQEWENEWRTGPFGRGYTTVSSDYQSHYNTKIKKCLLLIEATRMLGNQISTFVNLIDAYERRPYATYAWSTREKKILGSSADGVRTNALSA